MLVKRGKRRIIKKKDANQFPKLQKFQERIEQKVEKVENLISRNEPKKRR